MAAYDLHGIVPRPTKFVLGWRHWALRGIDILPPLLADKNIEKLHKPTYRLASQPDALRIVDAQTFNAPQSRRRRSRDGGNPQPRLPLEFFP